MNNILRLWLLGMGILPEQIEDDVRLMEEIKAKDGVAAWRRLSGLQWQRNLHPHTEFNTSAAELEFICFVNGKPALFM